VLAGGVDGLNVFRQQASPGVTWSLVVQRVAQGAAHAVVKDLDAPADQRRLLRTVTREHGPGDLEFASELRDLHWRLYGVRADDDWQREISDFWRSVEAASSLEQAWASTVSVMVRDPSFVAY